MTITPFQDTVNYLATNTGVQETAKLVVAVNADGSALAGGNSIGLPSDAAWDGVAANATVISLLKAIALNTTTP
jgi:hypothetical protein